MIASERLNEIAGQIIAAAIAVHRALGPGLLESAYERCLLLEMVARGLCVAAQVPVPLSYQGTRIECAYRVDLVVEDAIVVEIKAIEALGSIHVRQMVSYLRLTGHRLGLLINFNEAMLKNGVRRVVDRFPETQGARIDQAHSSIPPG